MSDNEDQNEENPFCVERAKQGRASCKKCKEKLSQGELRIAKLVYNPFGSGKLKSWHHVDCLFEVFLKQRPTTKRLESDSEITGWDEINQDDKDFIATKFEEFEKLFAEKNKVSYIPKKLCQNVASKTEKAKSKNISSPGSADLSEKDNLFREFRRLIANITNENSYLQKTAVVNELFTKGTDGKKFKGDVALWVKLLLPSIEKRIFNLQSKQLVKIFSRIFKTDLDDMLDHLKKGDVGETIQYFYENNDICKPVKKTNLTLQCVDKFLDGLSKLTKEDDQIDHFKLFLNVCTGNDLKVVIRLIKHDLRMNAGAKHILDGVHSDAYEVYQTSRDLKRVVKLCLDNKTSEIAASVKVLTPVLPMLAQACESVEKAMKKCPNGMYSEIKYDGERVQLHKKGAHFKYFSRSLKPVMQHKVAHFEKYIPQAFPHGKDLILDSEILMVDIETGKPLPFGSLGKHKRDEFSNSQVCLYIFDCIYYNGEDLTRKPLRERKDILRANMSEIKHRIMFSEMEEIHKPSDLARMIGTVLKMGLEGLVLKDIESIYEPGKRHWLKVKKDYLVGGSMADTADLIVLGAWYGTGKKGGMMSVFLMGVYDPKTTRFCTVTKVHTGHDDKTLEKLQKELDMHEINGDGDKLPDWLQCTKTMIPDFVAKDPKQQPIWEITGAEFTRQHDVHTANGISIRFPRVTRIRDDKDWAHATNLHELETLFKNSKEHFDADLLAKKLGYDSACEETNVTSKRKIDAASNSDISIGKKAKINNNSPHLHRSISKIHNPLPDYFDGVNLLVEFSTLKQFAEVLRQFVAYSGTVLSASDWQMSTHVLHDKEWVSEQMKDCPKHAKHVTCDWIKRSILSGKLQDAREYLVKLIPSKK